MGRENQRGRESFSESTPDPFDFPAEAYGVFVPGREGKPDDLRHGTFVIGRDGVVSWCQVGDQPFTDNRTLLYELAWLEGRLPQQGP